MTYLSACAKNAISSVRTSTFTFNIQQEPTVVACGAVACPFSVFRQLVAQFVVEQCSPDYQRISPASVSCYPLCQTSYNRQKSELQFIAKSSHG